MKSQEISMKLEKKKKKWVKNVTCVILKTNVFKAKPLFRDFNFTKAYLGHCETYMMELSCGNS